MGFLSGNIKRGDFLECNFGDYKQVMAADGAVSFDRAHYDSKIPHEIRKTRPVVVIGDHKGQYLVVPISSTEDTHNQAHKTGAAKGYHIQLEATEFPETSFYEAGVVRWAKVNMVQTVDRYRLQSIYCKTQKGYITGKVTPATLRKIQEALIKVIGLPELLL